MERVMTEKGCDNCYYTYFDEKAYPCSLCIRGIERTDMWQPSKKTKTEPQPCEWCKFSDGDNCFSQEPCKVMLYLKTEPQTEVRYSDNTDYQGAVDYVTDTDCSWKKGE